MIFIFQDNLDQNRGFVSKEEEKMFICLLNNEIQI